MSNYLVLIYGICSNFENVYEWYCEMNDAFHSYHSAVVLTNYFDPEVQGMRHVICLRSPENKNGGYNMFQYTNSNAWKYFAARSFAAFVVFAVVHATNIHVEFVIHLLEIYKMSSIPFQKSRFIE